MMLRQAPSAPVAAVVGGANVDIGGRAFARLIPHDSNPGAVRISVGGVGRNIAHNLCLLGVPTGLFTAWGQDRNGEFIASSCREAGIDARHVLSLPDQPTSTYLYVANPEGEMSVAISDMAVADAVTPAYLRSCLSMLRQARVIVADTNIPAESLRFLAENVSAPLFCDPVSVAKAVKLLPVLDRIHTLKPNRLEAEILSGIPVRSAEDALRAGRELVRKGVRRVFLSLGEEGCCAVSAGEALILPRIAGQPINATGCGDAMMAGLVWAWLRDLSLRETAQAGQAAASIALESRETINPVLSEAVLKNRMHPG